MKPKQDPRWPDAHTRLKKLYESKVPTGMSQEEFGQEYGLGSQGMVWQYLNGYTPLNFEAAAKFAKGLRCTIQDISPQMDSALKENIIPFVLGKAWRRAAVLAVLSLASGLFAPHNADAHQLVEKSWVCVLCQIIFLKIFSKLVSITTSVLSRFNPLSDRLINA